MNTATHYTEIFACHRCVGFARAFETFRSVNGGRCLACDGALRNARTVPNASDTRTAAQRRAQAIADIKLALACVGAPKPVASPWGYPTRRSDDTFLHIAAALSIAPNDVRVRGWAAVTSALRACKGDRAERMIGRLRTRAAEFSGQQGADISAWLGESAAVSAAA